MKFILTKFYIVIIFLSNCIPSDFVKFKLANVNCKSLNESWVRINQCRLKAISRNRTVFNFNGTLMYPAKDIWVNFRMFKRESGFKPWLLNINIDCCQFLRKPYNSIGIIVYNMYRNFSNVNHTCPFYGDILIQGMYLRTEVLRLPFPTGYYMLATTWSFHSKPQIAANISFEFVEDLI